MKRLLSALRLHQPRWIPLLGSTVAAGVIGTVSVEAQTSLPLHPDEPAAVSSQSDSGSRQPSAATGSSAADGSLEPVEVSLESSDPSEALVGLTLGQVRDSLTYQGWYFVARTPRLAQLENGTQGLDLALDPGSREIIEAALIDLN